VTRRSFAGSQGHYYILSVDGDEHRCMWCDCRPAGQAASRPCPAAPENRKPEPHSLHSRAA
jgi:hypothetical protein